MPRKDAFHDAFRNALIKDGWTITHDPYTIYRGKQALYIDIAAETPLSAEKDGRKIAVEIKSLLVKVDMPEYERALGQFVLYRSLLKRKEPGWTLYLAVSSRAYKEYFFPGEGRDLIADENLKIIVFDHMTEVVKQWIE